MDGHLINTLHHFRLDPMKILGQLHKPFVVVLVLRRGPDQLGEARHDGGHGPPRVLVGVPRVQGVLPQRAPVLPQLLVTPVLGIDGETSFSVSSSEVWFIVQLELTFRQ